MQFWHLTQCEVQRFVKHELLGWGVYISMSIIKRQAFSLLQVELAASQTLDTMALRCAIMYLM